MTQYVSESDVRGIAEYTCIHLNDGEVQQMTKDLNKMIEGLAPLREYDLSGVKPTFHPIGNLFNSMREDVVQESFPQDVALENAPKKQEGYFLIPSILGGEEGDR